MRDPVTGEAFARVAGRRAPAPPGEPPLPRARQALTELARCRTRVPKGVFVHRSHEEANADRDRWTVDAIVARTR